MTATICAGVEHGNKGAERVLRRALVDPAFWAEDPVQAPVNNFIRPAFRALVEHGSEDIAEVISAVLVRPTTWINDVERNDTPLAGAPLRAAFAYGGRDFLLDQLERCFTIINHVNVRYQIMRWLYAIATESSRCHIEIGRVGRLRADEKGRIVAMAEQTQEELDISRYVLAVLRAR